MRTAYCTVTGELLMRDKHNKVMIPVGKLVYNDVIKLELCCNLISSTFKPEKLVFDERFTLACKGFDGLKDSTISTVKRGLEAYLLSHPSKMYEDHNIDLAYCCGNLSEPDTTVEIKVHGKGIKSSEDWLRSAYVNGLQAIWERNKGITIISDHGAYYDVTNGLDGLDEETAEEWQEVLLSLYKWLVVEGEADAAEYLLKNVLKLDEHPEARLTPLDFWARGVPDPCGRWLMQQELSRM